MRFTRKQGLGNDCLYVFGDAPENARSSHWTSAAERLGALLRE